MAKFVSPVSGKDAKKIKPGTTITFQKGKKTLSGVVTNNFKDDSTVDVLVETKPGAFKMQSTEYAQLASIGTLIAMPSAPGV